ncbi:MAG: hypothetical protein ACK4UN_02425 [Limisphaerales bacterium]
MPKVVPLALRRNKPTGYCPIGLGFMAAGGGSPGYTIVLMRSILCASRERALIYKPKAKQ